MKVKITNKGNKITEKELKLFEKENNITFPEDFRQFLLKYNGGLPKPSYYVCGEGLGINTRVEQKVSLVQITEFFSYQGGNLGDEAEPENIFLFGCDLAGDYFGICLSGEDIGKIYFWSHEDTSDSDLYLIANNFDEFFNGLQENPNVTDFEKYCETNDVKSIKALLDNGLDINTLIVPNHDGYSLLNVAITARKPEIIKLLLNRGANVKSSFWSIYADQEIFDLLLSKGADINERDFNCETPLFRFVAMSETETIKLLIKNGADVLAKNNDGFTALEEKLRDGHLTSKGQETINILEEAIKNKN